MKIPLLIYLVIVTTIALVFIFLYFRNIVTLVEPSQCPAAYGSYGVDPGRTADALQNCGPDGRGPCTFNVLNLKQAVDICDLDSAKCQAFTYSELTRSMSYINPSSTTRRANLGGIYRRFVNPVILS